MVVRCKNCGDTRIILEGEEVKNIRDVVFISESGEVLNVDSKDTGLLLRYTKAECYNCGSEDIEDLDKLEELLDRYLEYYEVKFQMGDGDGDQANVRQDCDQVR